MHGATVTIEQTDISARTDEQGIYSLTIPRGTYTLIVEATGFEIHGETVSTGSKNELRLDFFLRRKHLEFEEIVIGQDDSTPGISVSSPTSIVKPGDQTKATSVLASVTDVPGVAPLGQGGLFQVPSIRGASRERTILMLEAVRVTSERRTGASFSFVDPLLLERLNITRGPAPVQYGSNGETGLIHATLLEPYAGPLMGNLRAGYRGNAGEHWQTFTIKSGTDKFQYAVGGARRESGDFESGDDQEFPSGFTRVNLFGKARWLTKSGSLTLFVLPSWTDNIDKASSDFLTRPTLYPEERHQIFMIDWQDQGIENGFGYQIQGWYHPNSLITQDDTVTNGSITSRAVVYNDTNDYGIRLRIGRKVAETWVLWSGVDYFERTDVNAKQDSFAPSSSGDGLDLTDSFYSIRNGGYRDAGFFLTGNGRLGKLIACAGIRIQQVKTSNKADQDVSDSENSWSGNLGASYSFTEQWEAIFNIGRGIRPATISEKFFTGETGRGTVTGNPDLITESNLEVDGGIRYHRTNWFAGFYVFHNDIDDFIARVRLPDGSFSFFNLPEVRIAGVEGEGYYRRRSIRFYGNFHVIRGENDQGQDVNDIPPSRAVAGVEYEPDGGFWNGSLELVEQFEKTDPGPDELSRDAALIINTNIEFRLMEQLRVRLSGLNLTNKTYFDSADNRAPQAIGRSFGIELLANF